MHSMARCTQCQAEVPDPVRGRPLPRLETCPKCGCDLHACRQCRSWEPIGRRCRNPEVPEPRMDPERANYCDFLELCGPLPAPGAPKKSFDALFGDG